MTGRCIRRWSDPVLYEGEGHVRVTRSGAGEHGGSLKVEEEGGPRGVLGIVI